MQPNASVAMCKPKDPGYAAEPTSFSRDDKLFSSGLNCSKRQSENAPRQRQNAQRQSQTAQHIMLPKATPLERRRLSKCEAQSRTAREQTIVRLITRCPLPLHGTHSPHFSCPPSVVRRSPTKPSSWMGNLAYAGIGSTTPELDPARLSRFCPPPHLTWKRNLVRGCRTMFRSCRPKFMNQAWISRSRSRPSSRFSGKIQGAEPADIVHHIAHVQAIFCFTNLAKARKARKATSQVAGLTSAAATTLMHKRISFAKIDVQRAHRLNTYRNCHRWVIHWRQCSAYPTNHMY